MKSPDNNLDIPIEKLKGVSAIIAKPLKNLGISTVHDLLWHIPTRYEDFSRVTDISNLRPGDIATIRARVDSVANQRTWKKNMVVTTAVVSDATGNISAVWFNQPFLERTLRAGRVVMLSGKVAYENGRLFFQNPAYEAVGQKDDPIHTGRLVPVYKETRGITSRWLRYLTHNALPLCARIDDPIPQEIIRHRKLSPLAEAIKSAHFPKTLSEARAAKKRLAFDELFLIQLLLLKSREEIKAAPAPKIKTNIEAIQKFVSLLPFSLTDAQRKAAWEILKDMEKGAPMNRLLEGDVGSGKTVVAAIAALNAALTGWQTAVMSPTEILAHQHFATLSKLFAHTNINVVLITGKTATAFDTELQTEYHPKKPEALKMVKSGQAAIIIGTHSLIQEKTDFKNLGLVVLDEQHRFGVNQRAALVRGKNAEQTQNDAENMKSDNKLLYKELTYKIRKALFDVKKNLGGGHKEIIYQKAVANAFEKIGLKFSREAQIPVIYNNEKIGVYVPDFIVEDKIIVELKALAFVGTTEKKQIWNYLKGSKYHLALLVNYGPRELTVDRVIYSIARTSAYVPRDSASVPHLLSMTATPIPRTMTLTIYGDLDISILNEMPAQRKKIITKIIAPENRNSAYQFVRKEIQKGRQAFVICPRIDPSASLRTGPSEQNEEKISRSELSRLEVKSVKEEYEKLSRHIFPDLAVAMLHGKMKSKEKENIMREFKEGRSDILVSTSVIEVGIDIPNASVMMIEGAERFGLAQLHQFRGRVGRSEHQSYCLLLSESDYAETNRRLAALLECNDGFKLAEKDLAIRGPGDFLGTRQSGLPDLAMASLNDAELIKSAREEAKQIIKEDARLSRYPKLRERLMKIAKEIHFE